MKLKTRSSKRSWMTLACVLALALMSNLARAAGTKPTPLKVGQIAKVTLGKGESRDYSVALGKGAYRLVWDARRLDGETSNIIGKIRLLKPNGAVIDSSILGFNEIAASYRVGTVMNVAKPFVARFRIENEYDCENWFSVAPVNPAKRVSFGWGAKVTPARISSDNGVGGTLEKNQSVYHSVTLPKGKWSISLGLSWPNGESSNLIGTVDLLDSLGFAKTQRLVSLNESGAQARGEGIVTITKPTPVLLRVVSSHATYTYDLTIEPAS